LGDEYYKGDNFEKNNSNAEFWYKLAAKKGHIEAQFKLGDIYNSVAQNQDTLHP
jgi:TPR repeat protein